MKKIVLSLVLFLLPILSFGTEPQSEVPRAEPASPLSPGKPCRFAKIGASFGVDFLLTPEELIASPDEYVSRSGYFLGDLDAVGLGPGLSVGIVSKIVFNRRFDILTGVDYLEMKGRTPITYDQATEAQEIQRNSLSIITSRFGGQYAFLSFRNDFAKIYAATEIQFNSFTARMTVKDGPDPTEFTVSDMRIGVGLGLGTELKLTNELLLDFGVRYNARNLFLREKDTSGDDYFYPITAPRGETEESSINSLSIRLTSQVLI